MKKAQQEMPGWKTQYPGVEELSVAIEDGRIAADGPPAAVLANDGLLVAANLIHEHLHEHGVVRHTHAHDAVEGHHDGPSQGDADSIENAALGIGS